MGITWGWGNGHRRASENQAAPERAAPHLQQRVEALRRIATERKLLLLDCSILRCAPFSEDGRTIWELLPKLDWFIHRWHTTTTTIEVPAHAAIEAVKQLVDGYATPGEIDNANRYFGWVMRAIDLNRTNYYPDPQLTPLLRGRIAHWIAGFSTATSDLRNILDYYLVAYPGWSATSNYSSSERGALHTDHRSVALALIDDIFGSPFHPAPFSSEWHTDTAIALAKQMYDSGEFSAMPILADALQDAGCDNVNILNHCRDADQIHVRGCWVVDLLLGKK